MPVSKRRKGKKHLARTPLTLTNENTERWNVKLNGSRLPLLRNDHDFLTFIKIGRAVNAVLYAIHDVLENLEPKTITQVRQYQRGCFVLAGYLHEGIKLVSSIKGRYLTFPPFERLRALALDAETRTARHYVKVIRNYTAFHLDENDATTRRTLARLKPTMYILVSGDHKGLGATYYDIADEVDVQFLLDELSNDKYGEVTIPQLVMTILSLGQTFLEACNEFSAGLVKKSNLGEHVHVTAVK